MSRWALLHSLIDYALSDGDEVLVVTLHRLYAAVCVTFREAVSCCVCGGPRVQPEDSAAFTETFNRLLEEKSQLVKATGDYYNNVQQTSEAVVIEYWRRKQASGGSSGSTGSTTV